MRTITLLIALTTGLFTSLAGAEVSFDIEKTKTGILPTGDFYSLYNVQCQGQNSAAIVSMDRQRRWCSSPTGELTCFRSAHEASMKACATPDVAANDGARNDNARTN